MSRLMQILTPEPEPADLGIVNSDHLYVAITLTWPEDDGLMHFSQQICRDWRATPASNQVIEPLKGTDEGPYLERRKKNAAENKIESTLNDLRGVEKGKTAYVILSGPSVIRDMQRTPPRPGDVIIAVNRGLIYSPFPVDYFLVGDGVIDPERLESWETAWINNPEPAPGFPLYEKSLNRWKYPALNLSQKRDRARLIAHQWSDPRLDGYFGSYKTAFYRSAGKGVVWDQIGIDMGLPELEYCYNTGSQTLHLADLLGCNQIVIVGGDFAFTNNEWYPGEPHIHRPDKFNYVSLPSCNQGQIVTTTDHMLTTAMKFWTWAWMLNKFYNVRCVNQTGNGILTRYFAKERLDGTRHLFGIQEGDEIQTNAHEEAVASGA